MSSLLVGLMSTLAFAQSKVTVSGTVVDTSDEAVIGATVLVVENPSIGAMTNLDGQFTLKGVPANSTIRVSYVGMATQEVKVPAGGATNLKIVLHPDDELLDEVVVVGYGTQKKENLTGAVASVDVKKTMQGRPVADIGRALQGVTPGLSVTTTTGAIGQGPTIKLRGSSGSLNASRGTTPLILVDNVPVPDLSFVNPNDVESISVLKDAASSSIYGTRAAFGVLLITTKKGKNDTKPSISYSTNFAWTTPTVMPQFSKSYENAQAALDIVARSGKNEVGVIGYNIDQTAVEKMKEWEQLYGGMSEDELGEMQMGRDFEYRNGKYYFYRQFDPIAMFLNKWAPQQKHDITVTGGSKNTSYNIGLGYVGQRGPLRDNPDKYKRYTFTPSINIKVNDWLKVRGGVMFTHSTFTTPYKYTSGTYNIWYYLYRWPSFYPYGTYEGKPFRSAITEAQQANDQVTTKNYSRINVGTTITPIKNLDINFDYTFGFNNTYFKRNGGQVWGRDFFNTKDPFKYDSLYSKAHNRAFESSDYSTKHVWKAYGTYKFDLNDKHFFKLMAGFDAEESDNHGHSSDRKELYQFDKPEIALAIGDQYVDDVVYHYQNASAGFFGRINYDYAGKYLLEFNLRYDGSSKFPTGRKFGLFPSGSFGWRISEEGFFQSLKPTFSDLKLRGSFGTIGNQDVAANSYLSIMSSGTTAWLDNGNKLPFLGTPSVMSPTLTWERISTYDLGLDMRFFRNELGISLDFYRRITSDMHSPGETLPSSFGQSSPKINSGELTANGFELIMDYNHQFDNGLAINLGATFSTVKEVITKYNNSVKNIYSNYEGKVLGEIWGYETDRLIQMDDVVTVNKKGKEVKVLDKSRFPDQSLFETGSFVFGPGDVLYKDLDGDGKITYGKNTLDDHGDLRVIGNTRPAFEYSFTLGASYKGFDLNAFFQGVGKRNMWAYGSVGIPGMGAGEVIYAHQMDYWKEDNTNAYWPAISDNSWNSGGRNFLPQTRFLLNLAYLRMKNITLGYSLPKNLLSQAHIQSLRFYVSGENLFEIYNSKIPVDPEIGNHGWGFGKISPFYRTISVGAQITF